MLQFYNKLNLSVFKVLFFLLGLIFLSSCSKEIDPTTGKRKNYETNAEKRALKAAGDGIILGGKSKVEYEFSNSNPIWRASLIILEDIPLATANYAGGIIATDWYGASNSSELIKIQIVFNDNKLSVSSFNVKGFKKNCSSAIKCSITNTDQNFNNAIKNKILEKTKIIYQTESKKKK